MTCVVLHLFTQNGVFWQFLHSGTSLAEGSPWSEGVKTEVICRQLLPESSEHYQAIAWIYYLLPLGNKLGCSSVWHRQSQRGSFLPLMRIFKGEVNIIFGHREIIAEILYPFQVPLVTRSIVFWTYAHWDLLWWFPTRRKTLSLTTWGVLAGVGSIKQNLFRTFPALLCQVKLVTEETPTTFTWIEASKNIAPSESCKGVVKEQFQTGGKKERLSVTPQFEVPLG